MENRELTVDDLSSPVDESMQSEIQPAMSYFAEGGEVEQGLFSQQIPQRPTVQVPQQRLKRTASEMLQRMPQVPLGTMRFSPLSMPGILGRQIPRFAQGGEVDAEQRALMGTGMSFSMPAPISFETNIPSFTPTYAPPTGPVTTPGTAGTLGQYPGIGVAEEFKYQPTLYEQLSPAGLAAPATTFTTATGYTPTAQTTARPTVLSREEAMLKQPTLVRYEPDVKFGGLTTYTGPLQVSPYTGEDKTTEIEKIKDQVPVDRYALLGFRLPTEGAATGESKYWFNPTMGYVLVPGGYTPEEGSGWTEVTDPDFLSKINQQPETPINWTDTNFFVTDMYKTPLDQPRVSNLRDVFTLIAGSDVSEAAQNLFKNPTYGWVPDPTNPEGGSFNMTPEAVNNIRSSDPFKSVASDTVKKIYNELGYTVGGDITTATNVSDADVANWVNAISAGQTDIFRAANTITSPMRMSGQLQLTPDRPTLTSIYVNSGLTIPGHLNKAQIDAAYQKVLGRPVDNAGLLFYAADPSVRGKIGSASALEAVLSNSREAQVQAAYRQALGRPADPAGLAFYTSGAGRSVDIGAYLPTSREAQVRQAYQQVLGRAADTPGLQFYTSGAGSSIPIGDLRTMFGGGERPPAARFRGSPPEGEYADPVAALRERMRMRREAGTMDQGTARDRLKKFLGGEDLTPVRMAEGGDVSRESQVRKVYQDVLGRAADEAGLQYYTTGEGKRYAAAQLADMFGASREGQIQKLYQNVLGRSTDPGGMEYYLRGEGRALTPDQIAEGFRGSEEYKSKQRTAAPAAVTTTKGPRPLTREGLLQEAMLFGGNSYNALGAYGPNSLNRRGYLTEKGRQQMINEIQPKAVADLIMRGQSVGLSPDEIQQAVQSGWQRGAESNRDFVIAEREAQANFVPEWFKIASALAGAHMMGTQILNQGASSLAPAASGASVSSASVPVFGTPYTGMELGKIGAAAVQGYQNPNRASAANIVNTVFPSPFGALPRIEDIELFNQGGLVQSFGKGGAVKSAAEALKDVVVSIPSKLAEVEKYVLKREGKVGAERLQKAADEIKNLEDQYTTEALQRAFTGDNAKLLMIGDPSKFQDFATRLQDPYRPAVERYWREMSARGGGAPQVPFLLIKKDESYLPYISGHEGRHRNIAANELGYSSTLWQLLGEGGMREPLPRGSREEFLAALKEIAGDKPLVIPQDRWAVGKEGKLVRAWKKARNLPEPFKHGGLVHRQSGSPEYGEIAIGEGGFTKDTLRGLRSGKGGDTFLSDSAKMLRNVFGEGVSNLESVVRGSVAAIPGAFGDIESIFRDDKNRKLATTEEILRDRMPKRVTAPTKEAAGFEEVGTYLPLPIPAGAVTQAAKTAGKGVETGAAKMLEKLGPRQGRGWEKLLADTGSRSYVMKPKGGNWVQGASSPESVVQRTLIGMEELNKTELERTRERIKDARASVLAVQGLERQRRTPAPSDSEFLSRQTRRLAGLEARERELSAQDAVNNWVKTKLVRYIKTDMATPGDPARELAEIGVSHSPELHRANQVPVLTTGPTASRVRSARTAAGYPAEGMAQSIPAQRWELRADTAIESRTAGQLQQQARTGAFATDREKASDLIKNNPWISKLDPKEQVYMMSDYASDPLAILRFSHLVDELGSAVAPTSNLPENLRLTPEKLDKLTVPQAMQRVSDINAWRAQEAERIEKAGMLENLKGESRFAEPNMKLSFVEEPGGTWINLPDTTDEAGRRLCTSIGGAAGWCTQQETNALKYGSGDNRLSVLLDTEGRPHIQVSIKDHNEKNALAHYAGRFSQTWSSMDYVPTLKQKEAYQNAIDAWRSRNPGSGSMGQEEVVQALEEAGVKPPPNIVEIKPPQNTFASQQSQTYIGRDPTYEKQSQQWALNFLNSQEWGKVEKLDDLKLFKIVDTYDPESVKYAVKSIYPDKEVTSSGGTRLTTDPRVQEAYTALSDMLDGDVNAPRFMSENDFFKIIRDVPQKFSKGGIAKKAAEMLKNLGAKEEKLASKDLTTLQDFSTSLGDRIREGVASKEKIMNAMEFKYAPGQRVFTADSAKKNRLPYEILAKRLYGDQPVRETPISKASRDPETGKVLRTPYEPGYLVRHDHGNGEFSEYVLPESAIKGTVDKFFTGGAVKKPTTTNEPETSGMLSQASRFFKDLIGTAPVPSTLNMTPYESMYAFKDVGSPEKGRKAALNVYSSLLPALMRARFPDYVANSPATVLKEVPRAPTNVGEFDVFYRTIALDPGGVNSMLMEPYGKQGYIGMGSDTTTEDTLNALGTMLHESMHARTRGAKGKTRSVAHPAEQLKKSMATDRFDEMIRDIRISELPSVYSARSPVEVINEYFATATPIKQMADKDMLTRRTRSQLKEVDRLAKKYPELEKMRVDWERPEVFLKD